MLTRIPTLLLVNFCLMKEPSHVKGHITEIERIGLERAAEFNRSGSAYAVEHATRPSTIAVALGASPISLLSW